MSEEGTRTIKCNSPVGCCRRRLDGAEPLFSFSKEMKMQTSPFRRTKNSRYPFGYLLFLFAVRWGSKNQTQESGGLLPDPGLTASAPLFLPQGRSVNEFLSAYQRNNQIPFIRKRKNRGRSFRCGPFETFFRRFPLCPPFRAGSTCPCRRCRNRRILSRSGRPWRRYG